MVEFIVHFHRLGDGSVIECIDPEPVWGKDCLSNAFPTFRSKDHASGGCREGCADCEAGAPKVV